MIDITSDGSGAQEIEVGARQELPATLPVLPLRETVPFPDTLTPLAIGQERSVQLVNDVLAGNRMLVMVASREPDVEARSRTVPIERGGSRALPPDTITGDGVE